MLVASIPITFYNLKDLINLGFRCGNVPSTLSMVVEGPILLVQYDAMADALCFDFVSCVSSLASSLIRDGYVCDTSHRNEYIF